MTTDGPGATCPGGQQDPAARLDALVWLDPASDRDVALWRDIRLEMLTVAPGAFGSTLAEHEGRSLDEWRGQVASPVLETVVAVRHGLPVGAARLMRPGDGLPAELISMYVAPAHRGAGLSRRIVEAVLERAREHGEPTLRLDVMEDNPAARRLYEGCGFTVQGPAVPAHPEDPSDPRVELPMLVHLP